MIVGIGRLKFSVLIWRRVYYITWRDGIRVEYNGMGMTDGIR